MAGVFNKTMELLGFAEIDERDRYDDYDQYDDEVERDEVEREPRGTHGREDSGAHRLEDDDRRPREERGRAVAPVPADRRERAVAPQPSARPESRRSAGVPMGGIHRITTIHPATFNEAKLIGESFREGVPVIMNLTDLSDGDAKRLVDFAAGLVFGLYGSIDRITNKVFLLSPEGVSSEGGQGDPTGQTGQTSSD
ncbi:cell division protein SepF [Kytococcus sedentarius]|uniref:cell division protein SepF n=1 Tax=Kytococcus sedentarius TaxID=1276 RepID=UPI0035BBD637